MKRPFQWKMPPELTFLGRANWRDRRRPFGMRTEDRFAHVYAIGKTGVGKSSLLEFMIRQDIVNGHGLALFDPHGDLVERVRRFVPAERAVDVIYLNVPDPMQPFGFNPLENVPVLRRSLVANSITEALKKMFTDSWGIRLEYLLRAALLLLLDQPEATIADVSRLFLDEDFRKDAATRATNEQVRQFWTAEFEAYPGRFRAEAISPIQNKLGSFLLDPFLSRILTARKSTFDPRAVMDHGKVLLVNLSKGQIGEASAALFGGLLVSALSSAGLSRGDRPEDARRPFFLYLDEFQLYTTLSLANSLSELRKYGVGFVLANQFLEQLAPEVKASVLGNVGTLITFRIGAADAARIAKELGSKIEVDDLTLLPNRTFWIRPIVRGAAWPPFTGRTIRLKRGGDQ